MTKLTLAGLGAAVLVAGTALGAQAMPLAPTGEAPAIEKVIYGDGCGPNRVRGPYGGCRWIGGRPGYGPRPYYGRPFYGPPRPYYRRPYYY